MLKNVFALIIAVFGSLVSQEPLVSDLPRVVVPEKSDVKVMGFASCSAFIVILMPGAGVSVRTNQWAVDAGINGLLALNTATATASKVWYSDNANGANSYVSLGVGPAAVFGLGRNAYGVCAPFRYGKEWDSSFWDVGVSAGAIMNTDYGHRWLPYFCPEVRGGLRF